MRIRVWQADDLPLAEAVLDPEPDSYWMMQRAGTHGIAVRQDRFAITLVAEDETGLLGCATMYENLFHPGHWPSTVEVVPGRRREGIGSALASALAEHCPADRTLTVKVRDTYVAGIGFATALGATPYQRCPVPTIDPSDVRVRRWARVQGIPSGARVTATAQLDPAEVLEAMITQYAWQHAAWSPMGGRELLTELWRSTLTEADDQLSSAAVRQGQIVALLPVFCAGASVEGLGETTHRDSADGAATFAACLARTLIEADRAGIGPIEFDGHDDDPHGAPVINQLPWASSDPCTLLQWRPA
ncbi:MAG: GNAT family N-acetyltransferase, partial [Propionibacteriales bacterium]|nr:GNAT family N-acetyltransferase [Propionibacteriales bacterium]